MSQEKSTNNKRIAKNTLLLYFRMFITMAVGLYTSRVVLQTLGVVDYGIYNIVGGIITMVSFLNVAMVSATQRFISYELGKSDAERLSSVFSTSVNIYLLICLVAIFFGETIGLWFVNAKLNIPEDRIVAANWVYQASILSFIISLISVPYNSAIVAHERMSTFAYISIVECVLKLLIVFLLIVQPFDKLIVYSILLMVVSLIIRSCYTIYCNRSFPECKYRYVRDKALFVEILSFAGWSVVGNVGFSMKDPLSNIILNLFFGPALNAARGIGVHVSTIINTFAVNFTMALNPQITKQFASGNLKESRKLVYMGSRISFYLLTLVSIPFIINVDYVLYLWLGEVPDYTSQFVIFSLITALLYSTSVCVNFAIQATGHIKWYQIGIAVILILEIPLAWMLLKMGFPPYAVMWPAIVTYTISIFFRFWLIQRYVEGYKMRDYLMKVLLPCLVTYAISYILSKWSCQGFETTFLHLLLSVVICIAITSVVIITVGINHREREFVMGKIEGLFPQKKRK